MLNAKKIPQVLGFVFAVMVLLGAESGRGAPASEVKLVLAEGGAAKVVIGLKSGASETSQLAAQELAQHLKTITGADFALVDADGIASEQAAIIVGSAANESLLSLGIDVKELGPDGIVIRTEGNRLFLSGGEPRGVLYAVYTFLEKNLGCEWWTSQASFTPQVVDLTIPKLNVVYRPKFLYRDPFYRDLVKNPAFAVKLKRNGFVQSLDPGIPKSMGGHMSLVGFVHTFYTLIPPATYFGKYPEWFSEINGKRTADNAQLCLTNQELKNEVVRRSLEQIKANPDAGIISISQNDNQRRCQCSECLEIEALEGGPSGPLILFINDVAAEIAKVAPDYFVETLAYQYTQKPPKNVVPAANVIIRLCSVECDSSVALNEQKNVAFMGDLAKWSTISQRLFIWDYAVDFLDSLRLHPNLMPMTRNIPIFAEAGVIGVFEQGFDVAEQFSDFIALKAWVTAHLLWDPSEDASKLRDRFLTGYYGAAASSLKEYLELMEGAIRDNGKLPGFGEPDLSGIDENVLSKAELIFDQAALAVNGDHELTKRVEIERISLKYARVIRYLSTVGAGAGAANFSTPAEAAAACDTILKDALSLGVNPEAKMGYSYTLRTLLDRRKQQIMTPVAADPKVTAGRERTSWVDFQENSIVPGGLGDMTSLVDDATASNGRAVRMKQGVGQWAIQVHAPPNPAAVTYRCYVVVRSEAPHDTGDAFQAGVYNDLTKESKRLLVATEAQARGSEYKTFDLGEHVMGPNSLIWIATAGPKGDKSAVFVDRVFMIKQD